MEREINRVSLRGVYRMISEIAKGNFSFKIKRSNHTDELEGLIAQFNMMAEQLNAKRHLFLWLNRTQEIFFIKSATFLLDEQLKIRGFSFEYPHNEIPPKDLILNLAFNKILVESSKSKWRNALDKLNRKPNAAVSCNLDYRFDEHLKINVHTVITSFITPTDENKIMVHSFHMDIRDKNNRRPFTPSQHSNIKFYSRADQLLFQNVHTYIMNSLDIILPSEKTIAQKFDTNAHKVRKGFKDLYGLSVSKYHAKQRVERAKFLIENTELSLKEISAKMGFNSYPHFSKNFKGITGQNPSNFKTATQIQ